MFLHAPNTVTSSLIDDGVAPWDFKATENITEQIRHIKEDRQAWYQNPDTQHYFYTGIEPLNPRLRVNKEGNPPMLIHSIPSDFDIACPQETIDKAIEVMKYKPSWVETSLSGNFRLLFMLEEPMRCHDFGFCMFILQQMKDWLNLKLLPCLDERAFENPTRLYCNGGVWRKTGHGPIPVKDSQYFFIQCAKAHRFKPTDSDAIPLETVEKALKEKYPSYEWPDAFEVNSQGPAHWFVPGSTSPMSAVVKPGGITCYSAHADKGFYTWADLLGSDFVKDFLATAYTEATRDCYWDGRAYWRKTAMGAYDSFEKEDFKLFLRGACKLSNKPGPSGLSPVEEALSHIQEHNKVRSAGPFVLRRQGIVDFNGERSLNIYNKKPIEPAPKTSWGPHGEFPFFSMYLPALFDPYEIQFAFAVTWLQQFYRSALEWDPVPGHSIILCGGTGCGKGLWNRSIVGASVGGFADAEGYLVRGESFNSHMMNAAHWVLDDDAPANSPGSRAKLAAALKKMAANQEFFNHEKFKVPGMVERMGRTGITCNLDFTSMRLICGSLDTSALDKLCLFKCVAKRMIDFPERRELAKIIARELPYFLRWVLDFVPPDFVQQAIKDDNRFGFKAYHNEELLDRSMQGSAVAPLKETLVEVLMMWFRDNAEAKEWSGTVTQIIRFIEGSGLNSDFARKYSPEQVNRYLEQMQSQKLLPISSNTGAHNMRIWTFQRIEGDLNFNNTSTPGVSFESPRPLPPEVK